MSHPILDALPGFPMKISAALPALDKAWAEEGEDATRASQMNVILMFGANVTPEDASTRFDEAIRFAQRYPCRLVVLAARPTAEAMAASGSAAWSAAVSGVWISCTIGAARRLESGIAP